MLQNLHVKNLALIDEAEVDFSEGLNVLSGETGAGKIITYASGKSADAVIWVVKRARDEHRSAIEWLNNHTDLKIGFFLCEIKLYKIGNSKPAVNFEVIEKPNDWSNKIRKEAISTPSHQFRYEYWTQFNEYAENNALFITAFL